MHINEFDYHLPEELIAQLPCEKRDCSRLMVLNKDKNVIEHKKFFNIVDYLTDNDILIINNTKVIPARLIGQKDTGAKIEVFLLKEKQEKIWESLIKPAKRVKPGTVIKIAEGFIVKVIEKTENDKWKVELLYSGNFYENLEKVGNIPLPPYIERKMSDQEIKQLDMNRYQTVYAQTPGSVAAPTAGLHFTDDILEKLKQRGVQVCSVTLNVGLGTFRSVKVDNILEHKMDEEFYEVSEETAKIINNAKEQGKNIVAVGTTSVRTLESVYKKHNKIISTADSSDLFIYPGYKFNVVDKIITNFHLPKSTLLMLVSAFASRNFIFDAYNEAIENKYRFYSYGDCMFIH